MTYVKNILLAALLFAGCSSSHNEDEGIGGYPAIQLESYVTAYTPLKSINLHSSANRIRIYEQTFEDRSKVYFFDEIYNTSYENYENYKRLRDHYSDKGYDGFIVPMAIGTNPHQFFADIFRSIDVVSDSDFDEHHPAGVSLTDITTFVSLSPYKFIKSGYTPFDWDTFEHTEYFIDLFSPVFSGTYLTNINYVYPIYEIISKLTSEDLSLLGRGRLNAGIIYGPFAVIEFNEPPSRPGTHTITVTFTNTEDEEFSATIDMNFQ